MYYKWFFFYILFKKKEIPSIDIKIFSKIKYHDLKKIYKKCNSPIQQSLGSMSDRS